MCEFKNYNQSFKFFDEKELIIPAFRYYLGRYTIIVHTFCNNLCDAWDFLKDNTKEIIKKELEEAFKKDEELQKNKIKNIRSPLGHNCDKNAWLNVRKKYIKC